MHWIETDFPYNRFNRIELPKASVERISLSSKSIGDVVKWTEVWKTPDTIQVETIGMAFIVKCDRCGKVIDQGEPPDSGKSQTTVTLNMGDEFYNWQLHKKCARKFKRQFQNWIARAVLNPPR